MDITRKETGSHPSINPFLTDRKLSEKAEALKVEDPYITPY